MVFAKFFFCKRQGQGIAKVVCAHQQEKGAEKRRDCEQGREIREELAEENVIGDQGSAVGGQE